MAPSLFARSATNCLCSISSLVLLVNPKHATTSSFGDVAKGQIKDLRVQMEKAKAQAEANPGPSGEQTNSEPGIVFARPMRSVRAVPVPGGLTG